MSTKANGVNQVNSDWSSGNLVFYEKSVGRTATGDVLTIGTAAVKVGGTAQDIDFQWYGTGSVSAILDCGDSSLTLVGVNLATNAPVVITDATESTSTSTGALIVSGGIANAKDTYLGDDLFLTSGAVINFNTGDITITHAANGLAFAGATSANATGFSFDMAAGAITSEAHAVDITCAGTMASGKSLVGLNSVVTPAGSAGTWAAAVYGKIVYGTTEVVSGYACGAEFEWAAGAAADGVINCDRAVLVLNYTDNSSQNLNNVAHKSWIQCRNYGTNLLNYFVDFTDETAGTTSTAKVISTVSNGFEANCDYTVQIKFGTTSLYLLASSTVPA